MPLLTQEFPRSSYLPVVIQRCITRLDVPVPLRQKLEEDHAQPTVSATILIANKKGREELVRALQGEPSNVQCRLADSIRNRHTERSLHERRQSNMRTLRRWLEFIIPLAIGGSLWVLIESRF